MSVQSGVKVNPSIRKNISRVDRLLLRCYGDRARRPPCPELLDSLVHTILSQNTSDVNSQRAFESLKERYPEWDAAAAAGVQEIEEAIRSGGISRVKAGRIKDILDMLHREGGAYSLEHVREMEPHEAMDYLVRIPGVGRKTAAVVLLFQLDYPFFPVDTHILRVVKRLGLIPRKATAEKAHHLMDAAVPDDMKYRLHINLIYHGRRVCKARNPRCTECCLNDICPRIDVNGEGRDDA